MACELSGFSLSTTRSDLPPINLSLTVGLFGIGAAEWKGFAAVSAGGMDVDEGRGRLEGFSNLVEVFGVILLSI